VNHIDFSKVLDFTKRFGFTFKRSGIKFLMMCFFGCGLGKNPVIILKYILIENDYFCVGIPE